MSDALILGGGWEGGVGEVPGSQGFRDIVLGANYQEKHESLERNQDLAYNNSSKLKGGKESAFEPAHPGITSPQLQRFPGVALMSPSLIEMEEKIPPVHMPIVSFVPNHGSVKPVVMLATS